MMRRIAVVGDSLARGGAVLPYGGPPCTFGDAGYQVALIGGQAFCEVCRSRGTIAKAGGPRRMHFTGEVALDGDLVLCKCPTPRRIVATLAGNAWYEDMGMNVGASHSDSAGCGLAAANAAAIGAEVFDELIIAVGCGGPIRDYPYFVETSDGRVFFGHTDEHGKLPRIATISCGSLTVFWGDEALADQEREGA